MRNMMLVSLMFLTGGLLCAPAVAQEDEARVDNPFTRAVVAFKQDLAPEDERHFSIMTSNYNIIQIVEGVQETLEDAVEACGQANPDMEERMETRFDVWNEAVDPILEEARAHIDNMVLAQDYASKKDIRRIFKLLEKTRKDADSALEKVPVTSKEGCEFALKNMDKSQVSFARLLRQTLISLPREIEQEDLKKQEENKPEA